MLKTLLTCTTIFTLLINSFSQEFTGFGPFKVNQTNISIIDSLSRAGFMRRVAKQEIEYMIVKGNKIVSPPLGSFDAPKIDNHKKFKIGEIEISGIIIKELEIEFYNGVLFDLNVNNPSSELKEAIELKYGKPKMEVEKKKIKCRSRIAGEFEEEEATYRNKYNTSIGLSATTVLMKYFNTKCEPQYINYLTVFNEKIQTEVANLSLKKTEELEKKDTEDKLKRLNGF